MVTWNTGYCALGSDADFIMDGGKGNGRATSAEAVMKNASGIAEKLAEIAADICLLQEVDTDSSRSCGNAQVSYLATPRGSDAGTAVYSAYAL